MKLERGTLLLISLDPTVGHEQQGTRPCIAVSDASVNADQRFPLLAIVPVTGTPGVGSLYPRLTPGRELLILDHLQSGHFRHRVERRADLKGP